MSSIQSQAPNIANPHVAEDSVVDLEQQREELLRQMQAVMSPEIERAIAIAIAVLPMESVPRLEFVTTGTKYAYS